MVVSLRGMLMTENVDPGLSSPEDSRAFKTPGDLVSLLSQKVVGQATATKAIVPYVYMYQSASLPRDAGRCLSAAWSHRHRQKRKPSKRSRAVARQREADRQSDCGEFQMEHEMAKLIGAPPGYLGHRETVPMLTQQRLAEATSEDPIWRWSFLTKSKRPAHSMTKLLLGILDKGILRLGDNSVVNFDKTLIFLPATWARARCLTNKSRDRVPVVLPRPRVDLNYQLEAIALGAVRKRFSPEFVNRIDAVVTYQPLDIESMETILDHDIKGLQRHVNSRLGESCFTIEVLPEAPIFSWLAASVTNMGRAS